MAEFGIKATDLSAPQGAGARPISPTETASVNPQSLFGIVEGAADIFAKGLKNNTKEQAEARKNAILSGYVNEETTINEAVSTGQMSASQAAARSRANFNKYASGYAEYITDFEAAGKALKGYTEKGVVEDEITQARNVRNDEIKQAQQMGYSFISGMSKNQEDTQINAAKTAQRAQQQLDAFYKASSERRAQGTYDNAQEAAELKRLSSQLINEVAGSNLTAFQSFINSLGEQTRGGKMTQQEAEVKLAERYSNISAAIQSAASTNPELASSYRSIFNDLNAVGTKLINSKEQSESDKALYEGVIARAKLLAITTNPTVKAAVVAGQLLPASAELALTLSPYITEIMSIVSTMPLEKGGYVPPIPLGDPVNEAPFLKLLKDGLGKVVSGNNPNKVGATAEGSNAVNHLLKQTGDLLAKGATPQQLSGLAAFFASPEYGNFAKVGKIDPSTAAVAQQVFQLSYTPTVTKGVTQKLQSPLPGVAGAGPKGKKMQDIIEVRFTGAGVSFVPKNVRDVDPLVATGNMQAMNELKKTEQAVNQLIHMGAHMEKSTDYAAHWEKNKHLYMPTVFAAPTRKPGDSPAAGGAPATTGDYSKESNLRGIANIESLPKMTDTQKQEAVKAIQEFLAKNPGVSPQVIQDLKADMERMK